MQLTDQIALEAARKIMALAYGPMPGGGSTQLQAQIQEVIIDALAQEPAQPKAHEAFEIVVNGERVAFDGVDEWAFPATYKRMMPLVEGLALLYRSALSGAAQDKDAERLDWLDKQREAYGFEDIQEGNLWMIEIEGPFNTLREAIDAAMQTKEQKQ